MLRNAKKHATVSADDGVNYREIAELLTEMGFPMNHSSARNHLVRGLARIAKAVAKEWGEDLDEEEALEVARSPQFQSGIADILVQISLAQSAK